MRDEKTEKKTSDKEAQQRERSDRRDDKTPKYVTEEIENPFICRGMD